MAQSLIRTKTAFTSATAAAAHAKRKPESDGKAGLPSDLRDLRIQQVLELRLRGVPIADIAKEFGAHPDTIRDDIRKARQTGLITKYRHQLMKRLVPKAFGVIEHHLKQNNLKAAEQVMALFRSESDRQHEKEIAKDSAEESLNDWWQRRKASLVGQEAPEIIGVPDEYSPSLASAEFCTAECIPALPPEAPAPASEGSPPGRSSDGSGDAQASPPAPKAPISPSHEQTGLALSYSFAPGGFANFADGAQFGQDSEETEEGI